jgi:hypothetical protein
MIEKIHIVSFDVPFPANYGGVIDVYNRAKALSELGVEVILHCFDYGRGHQQHLNEFCSEVHYYSRSKNPFLLLSKNPFIIQSRKNSNLLKKLLVDDAPILFEGHHTCFYLDHPQLKERTKLVRAHNVEHEYYIELAKAEKNTFKKWFFQIEGKKLKRFEHKLSLAHKVLTVSHKEQDYFDKMYHNAYYLPVFNPLSVGAYEANKNNNILFHGNLSVAENDRACHYLIDQVFSQNEWGFVIAGFKPQQELIDKVNLYENVSIIDSPSDAELNSLIRTSQINILFTFQNTGIKHKLLNALSNGGHCLTNNLMVDGTGLEKHCEIANDKTSLETKIKELLQKPYDETVFLKKNQDLQDHFNMEKNAIIIATELTK